MFTRRMIFPHKKWIIMLFSYNNIISKYNQTLNDDDSNFIYGKIWKLKLLNNNGVEGNALPFSSVIVVQ